MGFLSSRHRSYYQKQYFLKRVLTVLNFVLCSFPHGFTSEKAVIRSNSTVKCCLNEFLPTFKIYFDSFKAEGLVDNSSVKNILENNKYNVQMVEYSLNDEEWNYKISLAKTLDQILNLQASIECEVEDKKVKRIIFKYDLTNIIKTHKFFLLSLSHIIDKIQISVITYNIIPKSCNNCCIS